jgi:hypothetical protein
LKASAFETAILESLSRATGALIVTAEFLDKFLVAMHDAIAALHGGFAVESPSGVCSSIQKLKS